MPRFANQLKRLLRPRHIAVFGGRFAQAVIQQCDKMGFAGQIWPVHPSRDELEGRVCFCRVNDLPEAPDAVFIGVNRHQTIKLVSQLSQLGAGGVVCYASGFQETGDGDLNQQLIAAAGEMPVLGPNCYGFINYLDGALLWPDQHGGKPVETGVAILMQSSNISINLSMNQRAIPIAYLITLGNQAMVGLSDVVMELCNDPRVTAIGLHIEGLDELDRFAQAIDFAHQQGKPVVVLKTGKSQKAAQISFTHTASLSSNDAVMDALFNRLGIARVNSILEFLETLKILHVFGCLPSNDMVSLSCSGGEAALISDAGQQKALRFTDFSAADVARIKPTVHELVSISNPFDYHTFDWANVQRLTATFSAVMESNFTVNALLLDLPRADRCNGHDWQLTLSAWQTAAQQTNSKALVIASLPESMPEQLAQKLIAKQLVPLCGIEDALSAIAAAATINPQVTRFVPLRVSDTRHCEAQSLNEYDSKRLLAEFNVSTPKSSLCMSKQQALEFADRVDYPLVAKAVADDLEHKTEMGAVRLNIKNADELGRGFDELLAISATVMIEKMITDSQIELIVGVNKDPVIGLYLVIGAGGIFTELIGDTQIILLPFEPCHVERAIDRLKISALLNGYRGKAKIDKRDLIQTIISIQTFVIAQQNNLFEMDINPLIVTATGKAIALDALIRLKYPG